MVNLGSTECVVEVDKSSKLEEAEAWAGNLEDPTDKFKLKSIIGTGNTSVVYEAADSDGNSVAIKIQEESQSTVQGIHTEFQLLTLLSGNTRFPKLFGAYRNATQIWFILELCEEGSVQALLSKMSEKGRFLSEDVISYILRSLILNLKDLHDLQTIHRDVKCANILICKNGEIKLTDLGMAVQIEEGSKDDGVIGVVGSPCWMAPEVVLSERMPPVVYDFRVDVWSLGITAMELGEGSAPKSEVFPPRALFQIVQHPPPTLTRPLEWSQLYNDFISECLEKNPDHRPWLAELPEHPFIVLEDVDEEVKTKDLLLKLVNEFRDEALRGIPPEVSIKSDTIKMERHMVASKMFRDDLATLDFVTEENVMETLEQRFRQGNSYTYVGDIMLIINPFHDYPIYGPDVAAQYKFRARCDNAPHIYGVGDRAYQDMTHHQQTQNIILTGETGSGKTTAGKHLLWHLVNMATCKKRMGDKVLQIPVVMEAFGQASSIFNENSTRHIQYLELFFTRTGKLSGGVLWAYSLEKWRVTHNQGGRNQSNFHVFYYLLDTLCATDSTDMYFLEKGKVYEYLPPSSTHPPPNSVNKFRQVKEALSTLGFSDREQENIFKIVSAIILIGQIKFEEEEDGGVTLSQPQISEHVSTLFDVDAKKLSWALCNYCVISKGEAVRVKSNATEAEETRDSLARSLYTRLVDWIVNLINTKMTPTHLMASEDKRSLGILDMPGFECFMQDNTLDQFLVNLINEQMQFFYNQRVFSWEMEDYISEDFSHAKYKFHDNRELLDSVLSKPNGLLALLDQETKTTSPGNIDGQHFLDGIKNLLRTRFIRVTDESSFIVVHYSGKVSYNARNFLERNKNFLSPEIIALMRQSTNASVAQLFTNPMTITGNLTINTAEDHKQTAWATSFAGKLAKFNTTKSRGKFSQRRQMQTMGGTMRNSLLEVLQRVYVGSSHFVRCIRPNLHSKPSNFDYALVKYQIRALGIIDSIRVRQTGFSSRLRFSEFLKRYKFLAFDFDEEVEDTRDNCRLLLIRLKLEGWALGETKVMLKYYNEEFLSRLYEEQVHKVVKIQAMIRAFLSRKKLSVKPFEAKSKINEASQLQKPIIPKTLLQKPELAVERSSSPTPSANIEFLNLNTDVEEEGRRSPRQIASDFESKTGKNGGRALLTGRSLPSSKTTNKIQKIPVPPSFPRPAANQGPKAPPKNVPKPEAPLRKRSGPEFVNPLVEFTNAANKMYPPSSFEEPGPFNFQAMLRKTNTSIVDLERHSTTPVTECYGQSSSGTGNIAKSPDLDTTLPGGLPKRGRVNSGNVAPSRGAIRSTASSAGHHLEPEPMDSFAPSPEPNLTRRTSNASSVIRTDPELTNGIQTNGQGVETVTLSAQLVLEGVSEDL